MSFRSRLTYALFFFGAIFLICPILIFYYQVKGAMSQNLDDALRSVARAELASTFDDPDEGPHVHESSSPLLVSLDSGLHEISWILDDEGAILAKSADLSETDIQGVKDRLPDPGPRGSFVTVKMKGISYRLLVAHLAHRGQDYLEVFGLSREPLLQRLSSLRKQAGFLFLIALLVLILAARRLSASLTQPLTDLSNELERLDPTSESALSIHTKPKDKELKILYESMNSVLARLDYMLETQKHFVSDTSHEIRAPLTNLRLALEVCLRKQRSSEEYKEVLGVCEQEVSRLGHMAERLLTLSRLDSDQLSISPQDVELVKLMRGAVDMVSERLEQKDLKLDLKCPEEVCLKCDAGAVRQILDNLLDNAVRYAPTGSTVRTVLEVTNGKVRVSIENGGNPLTSQQCERVFERFFRGDASRQRETGGAGLGLSIVKGLVRAHGGQVGVEPLPDQRIRFWFTLPSSHPSSIMKEVS